MEWIEVTAKLPKIDERVLVYYNGGVITISKLKSVSKTVDKTVIGLPYIEIDCQWYDIGESSDVSHWCYLVPPK